MNRAPLHVFVAVLVTTSFPSLAQRPPAQGHAPAELLVTTGPATPGARFLATLPAATRKALQRNGQVLLDQKMEDTSGMVRAVLRFERPLDEVFALITQPSLQTKYLPHVTKSKTVGEHTPEGEATDMEVTVLVTIRYRTQHWFYPEEHRMEWTLDPSGANGLKEQSGYFQLYALDDQTTVAEYGTKVVARDKLINAVRRGAERASIADALVAMRKYVAAAPR